MELSEIVKRLEDGKLTVKRIKLTPAEVHTIFGLYDGTQTSFVSLHIKRLFDKCGIKTVPNGIGWEVPLWQ